jgi:hypothetical protein
MDRGEAQLKIAEYARQEMTARSGPLRHHKLRLIRFYKGKTSEGDDAWVGRYKDQTGYGLVCVRVWKTDETIVSENFSAEVDDCTLDTPPSPPPPA